MRGGGGVGKASRRPCHPAPSQPWAPAPLPPPPASPRAARRDDRKRRGPSRTLRRSRARRRRRARPGPAPGQCRRRSAGGRDRAGRVRHAGPAVQRRPRRPAYGSAVSTVLRAAASGRSEHNPPGRNIPLPPLPPSAMRSSGTSGVCWGGAQEEGWVGTAGRDGRWPCSRACGWRVPRPSRRAGVRGRPSEGPGLEGLAAEAPVRSLACPKRRTPLRRPRRPPRRPARRLRDLRGVVGALARVSTQIHGPPARRQPGRRAGTWRAPPRHEPPDQPVSTHPRPRRPGPLSATACLTASWTAACRPPTPGRPLSVGRGRA